MEHSLVFTHQQEGISIDDAIMSSIDTRDGFVFSMVDVTIKADNFEKFISDTKEVYGAVDCYDYSTGKTNIFRKYKCENFRMYCSGNSLDYIISIYCKSEEICNEIWKIFTKYNTDDSETTLYFQSFYMNNGQLDESTKVIKEETLNYISKSYYPYIETDTMFEQFFTGDENILVVVGTPGLGKSKMSSLMLKYAFKNTDKLPYDKLEENIALDEQFISVIYVKSTDVLSNDKFWRKLSSNKVDVVILDDLDYMLTKRDSEVMTSEDQVKNNFLNQFLSFTDGVEKNKTKFIITTNQSYDEIDTALLRKGRLFDILELRKLSLSESEVIWLENKLDIDDFNATFTTHEVLPADLGSEINKRLNKRIDSATKSYLKEDGISKIKKAGRNKKIGL